MKRALFASAVFSSLAMASLVSAQPGGGGGFGRGGGPPGGGGIGMMLQNEQVREELGIEDAQAQDVQEVLESQRESMMQALRDSGLDFRSEEDRDQIRELFEEQNAKVEEKLGAVLKPEQLTRLKQINRQMQNRRPGGGGIADNETLQEELGLTEAQLTQLREMAPKVQEELRKAMQEAQAEAEAKLLSALTPSQQAKYKELMGETFQFDPARAGQGGPGGGRGGFGGGGPGGPGGRGPGGPPRGGNNDSEELPEL